MTDINASNLHLSEANRPLLQDTNVVYATPSAPLVSVPVVQLQHPQQYQQQNHHHQQQQVVVRHQVLQQVPVAQVYTIQQQPQNNNNQQQQQQQQQRVLYAPTVVNGELEGQLVVGQVVQDNSGLKADFQRDLFSCSDDWSTCCLATVAPCAVMGQIAHLRDGTSSCMKTFESCSVFWLCSAFLHAPCVWCCYAAKNRALTRDHLGIKRDNACDCFADTFCLPCSLTQQKLELMGRVSRSAAPPQQQMVVPNVGQINYVAAPTQQ